MEVGEIRDANHLKAWLEPRPSEDAIAVAQRTALRVFPLFGQAMDDNWARNHHRSTMLPIIRALLTAGVRYKFSTPEAEAAATKAQAMARSAIIAAISRATDDDAYFAIAAADAAATALATALARSATNATETVGFAIGATLRIESSASYIWEQIREDARVISQGSDPYAARVWSIPVPAWFNNADLDTRAIWAKDHDSAWDFWLRWWDGVLSGVQLDWDLQKAVALISDDIWRQGPVAISEAIRDIEERRRLLDEVIGLRRKLQEFEAVAVSQASATQRAHNNPPELIEPEMAVLRVTGGVVEALLEAETELVKSEPAAGVLRRVVEVLLNWAKVTAFYCGGLADIAVRKGAEEVGSTGVKLALQIGGLSLVSQMEPIQALAKALANFATKLTGG